MIAISESIDFQAKWLSDTQLIIKFKFDRSCSQGGPAARLVMLRPGQRA